MKIALGVEYDGSRYHGWQRQKSTLLTIQEKAEQALSAVATHKVAVVCAGRTDAGVHAFEQVIHFETSTKRMLREWMFGGNANLPADIRIIWAKDVTDDFHARFSAAARYYRYEILNRCVKSALYRNHVTTIFQPLDEQLMQSASQALVGTYDFSSFQAQGCQAKSPIKQLHWINIKRYNDKIVIDIIASAFLHHMVRNIVGTLLPIGLAKEKPEWLADVLEAKDRKAAGVTARANGLFFIGVYYPKHFALPNHRAFDPFCNQIEQPAP
ncbi:MAG: tRNA pseudouridine(38-40) synthase TruA [Piscirickettsiaceae bacterium]|nr:MAG: tRNA pseudouridine(38-40) synthase TruA [Piscirickettsiaceae bacterium]